ncbi:STAS domain-containing protein [Streptomyces sp. NPDC050095]
MPDPVIPEIVRQYETHGHVVVELHGEVDILAADLIGPLLDEVTARRGVKLVIDLTPTQFLDCVGLELLCRAHRRVLEGGGTFRLVCPHPFTLRLIRMARLGERLQPVATPEQALVPQV